MPAPYAGDASAIQCFIAARLRDLNLVQVTMGIDLEAYNGISLNMFAKLTRGVVPLATEMAAPNLFEHGKAGLRGPFECHSPIDTDSVAVVFCRGVSPKGHALRERVIQPVSPLLLAIIGWLTEPFASIQKLINVSANAAGILRADTTSSQRWA